MERRGTRAVRGMAAAILGEADVPAFVQGSVGKSVAGTAAAAAAGAVGGVDGSSSCHGHSKRGMIAQVRVQPGSNAAAVELYLKKKAEQKSQVKVIW